MVIGRLIGGLTGIIVGKVFELLLSIIIKTNRKVFIAWLLMGLSMIITGGYFFNKYYNEAKDHIARNTNGIKYDAGLVEKVQTKSVELKNYNLELNNEHAVGTFRYQVFPNQKEFDWNGEKFTFMDDSHKLKVVKNADGSKFLDHELTPGNILLAAHLSFIKIRCLSYPGCVRLHNNPL